MTFTSRPAGPNPRSPRAARKLVLLILLVPYLAVELAFNHQLLTLSTGLLDSQALRGIEIWGRLISGVGLGLLIWIVVLSRYLSALPALVLSLALGLGVMWHLQRMIVDHWVSMASDEDKQLALALNMLSQPAASGALRTGRGPLLKTPADPALRSSVASLFPAAALHATERHALVRDWARQMGFDASGTTLARLTPEMANNAYRNLIVPPLALGLSLLFALLNMAQLGFALIRFTALSMRRDPPWLPLARPMLVGGLIAMTIAGGNDFVNGDGFRLDLRPGMWREAPVLALLTEWSLRAEPVWYPLAEWAHQTPLMNASFRHPWPGSL